MIIKETPSQLNIPSYVMNFPFTLSTENPNNIWMQEMSKDELKINKSKAYKQFMDLYNFMSSNSLIYTLPSSGNYQDQVYVANLGMYLPHIKNRNIMLLSNFTSEPRRGEEWVGKTFFDLMGYETHISPYKWEGEADLKYIGKNNYIGGYGIRSQIETYEWMKNNFNMNIIEVEMVEPYLYHLDCSIFPISHEKTMMCTSLYSPEEISEIEKYTEIIDVCEEDAFDGITNSVRLGNMILCASNIDELGKNDPYYNEEKHKIETLESICGNEGMEPIIFNLSEFYKSGALLSCMIQRLNWCDYKKIT